MSLLVQLSALFSLCILSVSVANDVAEQVVATKSVKQWALDWQSDPEEVKSSLMSIGPNVDPKSLLEDILLGKQIINYHVNLLLI